ncbi:MAG TPA: hypothetical protein PKD83_05350 [Ignavibacteria bacterium]|nr:hypothetical protein [Ignavibacteria bacterium]
MKNFKLIILLTVIFTNSMIFESCYHNLQPGEVDIEKAGSNFQITTPSKCHTFDGSVIIYREGFNVVQNNILGTGWRYYFDGNEEIINVTSFPLDSIIAITTYDDLTGGRAIANVSLGLVPTVIGAAVIYCAICPKCCFGSCPTIYTFDIDVPSLETELFSSSISRMLEGDDLDKLKQKIPENGIYEIKITNEAMETHYIDKFNLILAEHPSGTNIFPNINKGLTIMNTPLPPENVFNSVGKEITKTIYIEDTLSYRSGMEMVNELKSGPKYDWIAFTSSVPENAVKAKLLVRYRNTLLSTILFYDVVLGSQGIKAVEWIEKMNNDAVYAQDFKMIYDNFSGMQLEKFENGEWISAGIFPDAGPICWKDAAAEIPVLNTDEKELRLRVKFIPDNFMIDYIGIEFCSSEENKIAVMNLIPSGVINNSKDNFIQIYKKLESADKNYLITGPGDSYSFIYKIEKRNDIEQSLLISSKGYYNEWLRGSWIKNDSMRQAFNLYNINENLRNLAESWEMNKTLIESEFFHTRIPVKEK